MPCSKSYREALFLMLIARRRPFAVRKKYGDGFPSRSLIIGWGPVSTWWLHNAEFNSASKPEETIAPSEASPPCSNIQIIKSDRRDARLIIMQTSRSSVRLAEVALSFDTGGMLFPLLVALIAGWDLLLSANLLFVAAPGTPSHAQQLAASCGDEPMFGAE